MIYTNFFNIGEAHETKDKINFIIDSRSYRFTDTFSKKFTYITLGTFLTSLLVVAVNTQIFTFAINNNAKKIEAFETERAEFELNVVDLETGMLQYNKTSSAIDTILNISDKTIDWAAVTASVKNSLPEGFNLESIEKSSQADLLAALSEESNGSEFENSVLMLNISSKSKANLPILISNLEQLDITYRVDCTKTEKSKSTSTYNSTIYLVLN